MRLQRQSNQQIITLDATSTLGHGGEARVYPLPQDETLVAKIYHKPTKAHADKLAAMLANPPENPMVEQGHISIAWPFDLLRALDGSDRVVGFLMPRVKGMNSILDFYNPKSRRQKCPFFNYLYLHRTARNLAAAVGAIHARGYCVGDVNESNILVGNTALVTLVDTDSFQVSEQDNSIVYRCPVGKAEFTPPELQGKSFAQLDRAIEHDLFGLAVVLFQLLMEGTHPFSGIFQGAGDPPPYETRISSGHFSYSTKQRVPYTASRIAPPFELLHPNLQQLFIRCFEDGHHNPLLRPNTQTWQNALKEAEAELITCTHNTQHRYGKHLQVCPWCERTVRLVGRDPFPSWQAVKQGQHLKPIKPRRPTPTKRYQPPAPKTRTFTPVPLLKTIPAKQAKKNYGLLLLGLLGVGVLGLLEVMLVVNDVELGSGATLFQTNNAPVSPKLTNQRQQGFTTHYDQGNAEYDFGNYKQAIENFSQALNINPKDAKAYLNRGNAYFELAQHSGDPDKDYKGAIENFNQAINLNPNQIEAYISRGMVRSEIAQYSKDPDGEYKQAIEDFNQALRRHPAHTKAYVQRGIVRYKLAQYKGDANQGYKQAIKDFDRALLLNPQEAEAYVKRGLIRYELEQYGGDSDKNKQAAVTDLQKAAKIFLDQGDMEHYQQALGNICVALEDNCHLFLQNPDKFTLPKPEAVQPASPSN